MRVTVMLEMGTRTATEQHTLSSTARKDWRQAIGDIACRMELATYGPPGMVEEMTAEDQPVLFDPTGKHREPQ